jgi:hypothetical protein
LLAAAVVALVWVNVDASSYDSLWGATLSIDLGGAGVALDLRHGSIDVEIDGDSATARLSGPEGARFLLARVGAEWRIDSGYTLG